MAAWSSVVWGPYCSPHDYFVGIIYMICPWYFFDFTDMFTWYLVFYLRFEVITWRGYCFLLEIRNNYIEFLWDVWTSEMFQLLYVFHCPVPSHSCVLFLNNWGSEVVVLREWVFLSCDNWVISKKTDGEYLRNNWVKLWYLRNNWVKTSIILHNLQDFFEFSVEFKSASNLV